MRDNILFIDPIIYFVVSLNPLSQAVFSGGVFGEGALYIIHTNIHLRCLVLIKCIRLCFFLN